LFAHRFRAEFSRKTDVLLMLWLNRHLGPLEIQGRPIAETKFLHEARDRILGTILLPARPKATRRSQGLIAQEGCYTFPSCRPAEPTTMLALHQLAELTDSGKQPFLTTSKTALPPSTIRAAAGSHWSATRRACGAIGSGTIASCASYAHRPTTPEHQS
jgi:hypothetical protein